MSELDPSIPEQPRGNFLLEGARAFVGAVSRFMAEAHRAEIAYRNMSIGLSPDASEEDFRDVLNTEQGMDRYAAYVLLREETENRNLLFL